VDARSVYFCARGEIQQSIIHIFRSPGKLAFRSQPPAFRRVNQPLRSRSWRVVGIWPPSHRTTKVHKGV